MKSPMLVLAALWIMPTLVGAQSPSGAVPPAKDAFSDAAEGIGASRTVGAVGVQAHKTLGKFDKASDEIMDRADTRLGVIQHTLGAAGAYREGGAEGMAVYGTQELLNRGGEAAGETAAGAYTVFRAGKALTGTAGGAVGAAFMAGTFAGDYIKENVYINNQSIESHVTNLYWKATEQVLYQLRPETDPDNIMSDESIERHRQKLRQQRAAQFMTRSRTNEQAVAERASMTQRSHPSDDSRMATDMMLLLTPALISAGQAQQARQQSYVPAPSYPQYPSIGNVPTGNPYDTRGYNNGRRLDTGSTSSSSAPATSDSGRYTRGCSCCGHGCPGHK